MIKVMVEAKERIKLIEKWSLLIHIERWLESNIGRIRGTDLFTLEYGGYTCGISPPVI